MEKSEEKTARDLRVSLVQAVAAPYFQAIAIDQEITRIKNEISLAKKSQEDHNAYMAANCLDSLQRKSLMLDAPEFENNYESFLDAAENQQKTLKNPLAKIEKEFKELLHQSWEALTSIVSDIIAGKYGRGELHLSHRGIDRVFGRIEEFEEKHFSYALSFDNRVVLGHQDLKRIADACEEIHNTPLINVGVVLMPLSAEEARSLCRSKDDYSLLKKYIPIFMIPWGLGCVYCLNRDQKLELYLVCLGDGSAVVVRVDIGTYPHRSVFVLGKLAERNEDFIELELRLWEGKEGSMALSVELEDASDDMMAFCMISKHLAERNPGIIIDMPQLEKP